MTWHRLAPDQSKDCFKNTSPNRRPWLLVLGALVLSFGCQRTSTEQGSVDARRSAPVRATVVQPQRKTLVRIVELPGRVDAYEVTPLHAKVTGYVEQVPVDVGDRIRGPHESETGTVLCKLQVPELDEELAQKAAAVALAQAVVAQANAGVKVAEAALRSADAKVAEARAAVEREEALFVRWQSEYQRITQLADSGAVTRKVADEARAQRDAAEAGRKEVLARSVAVEAKQQEAVADLEKARADVTAAQARRTVAEADERRCAALVDFATIRAPFDGVVVQRNVHTGHLVQSGAGNLKPLLIVMRTDPVRLIIDVPETDAVQITPQSQVEITSPSQPGCSYRGPITRSSWSLNTVSRTLTAEIHVANPQGDWRPGQYVQAKLTAAEVENCLSVPRSAIVTQEKQTYCFVVQSDNTVRRLPISVGIQAGTDVEVLEGLTGNERVIQINAAAFREGQVVEPIAPSK